MGFKTKPKGLNRCNNNVTYGTKILHNKMSIRLWTQDKEGRLVQVLNTTDGEMFCAEKKVSVRPYLLKEKECDIAEDCMECTYLRYDK